jgi:hypothetical protein
MGDKSPKDKQKAEKKKVDDKASAAKKQQDSRDAKANAGKAGKK